jgi:hypothetical protein
VELLQPSLQRKDGARLQPIHFFRDQLQRAVPPDAPPYRLVWRDCRALRSPSALLATPDAIRAADAAQAAEIAGCAAMAELRCAVSGEDGVRAEDIPGFHLIRMADNRFRLMTAGHVLTFSFIKAQRRSGGRGDLVFERDCIIHVGDGVPLPGVRLSAPRFHDRGIDVSTMARGTAEFWSAEPHDDSDLGYFDLSFDRFPQAAASRALIAAIALRAFTGRSEALPLYGAHTVCTFGTGFLGSFQNRVRIGRCIDAGGVDVPVAGPDAHRCRFRAPTTAYFSGGPVLGTDEHGPIALCIISSEPGNEPSSPISGGIPVIAREHARSYSPAFANNGVIYPRD